MHFGESTEKGGRPPYVLDEEDIQNAQKMASYGYSKKAIAQALNVPERTLYDLMDRNDQFSQCIKKGIVKYCLSVEEMAMTGEISPTQYIYWSKTKWKHFYPQQEEEHKKDDDIKLTIEQIKTLSGIAKEVGAD